MIMTFNENPVRYACLVLKKSQKELSLLFEVSEGTINRWASNPNSMPPIAVLCFDFCLHNFHLLFHYQSVCDLRDSLNYMTDLCIVIDDSSYKDKDL